MTVSVLKLPLSMLCFRTIFTRLKSIRAATNVKTWFLTMAIATPVYAIDGTDKLAPDLPVFLSHDSIKNVSAPSIPT